MENDITYSIKITLCGQQKFFGPGTVTLLRYVDETHSLSAASKRMSLSYSKATAMINNAEARLGFRLLSSRTGGAHGGGSDLTDEAHAIIRLYSQFAQDIASCADKRFEIFKTELKKL